MELDVQYLEITDSKCPYLDWEKKLDKTVRGMIRIRINRLRLGNFGDCFPISGAKGIYELRFHFGSGYRVYFGKTNNTLVIILCGGIKGTQSRDIEKAKEYWQLYNESLEGNEYD